MSIRLNIGGEAGPRGLDQATAELYWKILTGDLPTAEKKERLDALEKMGSTAISGCSIVHYPPRLTLWEWLGIKKRKGE